MTRSVQEWVGRTDDVSIPARVRLRVFLRFDGRCQCGCNRPIRPGDGWVVDHVVALVNGGQHRESNMQPLLVEHHKNKTKADLAEKSRTYKRRKSHVGLRKAKHLIPGSKGTPWKKKVSGEVAQRGRYRPDRDERVPAPRGFRGKDKDDD